MFPTTIDVAGGRIAELRRGPRLAFRVLSTDPVRAALVPVQAGPLAGDHDIVRIRVGAGETLILDEPALIVPAGADVLRITRIELAEGAVVAWRDTVILGRAGEGPGRVEATTRVTLAGAPLLHETLRLDPEQDDAYVALPPGHRVAGTVALLGLPGNLAGPGSLWRATGATASEVDAALRDAWGGASQRVLSQRPERAVSSGV